jgi:hypothetical protein
MEAFVLLLEAFVCVPRMEIRLKKQLYFCLEELSFFKFRWRIVKSIQANFKVDNNSWFL